MPTIHPTAVIDPSAEIAHDVEIGPFCIIHSDAKIGSGTKLHSSVVVGQWTEIGENNEIYPGAVIGVAPQDLRYSGERAYTTLGSRNVIREYVTIHRASDAEGVTSVGDDNLIMAYTRCGPQLYSRQSDHYRQLLWTGGSRRDRRSGGPWWNVWPTPVRADREARHVGRNGSDPTRRSTLLHGRWPTGTNLWNEHPRDAASRNRQGQPSGFKGLLSSDFAVRTEPHSGFEFYSFRRRAYGRSSTSHSVPREPFENGRLHPRTGAPTGEASKSATLQG